MARPRSTSNCSNRGRVGGIDARRKRNMCIEKHPVRNVGQRWISFRQYRPAGFERDLQEETINHRELQFRTSRCAATVGCGSALMDAAAFPRHPRALGKHPRWHPSQRFGRTTSRSTRSMQHNLKTVDRLEPSEILDIPERLRKVPGNDYTIRELFHIMGSGHPRLEKDADCWNGVGQCAGGFG